MTKDPELRYTVEGKTVLNITLALNRHYRNKHGDVDTDFIFCTLWDRLAENTGKYCEKGSVLGITGRIQTRNYENREGKIVYVTEVIAEAVTFLSSKRTEEKNKQYIPE